MAYQDNCKDCDGDGRYWDGERVVTCWRCGGDGIVTVFEDGDENDGPTGPEDTPGWNEED